MKLSYVLLPQVTKKQALRAAEIYKEGWKSPSGEGCIFFNVSTALALSPGLRAILNEADSGKGCTPRTLERAMRSADPSLKIRALQVGLGTALHSGHVSPSRLPCTHTQRQCALFRLSPGRCQCKRIACRPAWHSQPMWCPAAAQVGPAMAHWLRVDRVRTSKKNLRMSQRSLRQTLWIDAKTIVIGWPISRKILTHLPAPKLVRADARFDLRDKHKWHFTYYGCNNYWAGGLSPMPATGSMKGIGPRRVYKVS